MNIYKVNHNTEQYEWLVDDTVDDWLDICLSPAGHRFKAAWTPPKFRSINAAEEGYPGILPSGDSVGLGVTEIALGTRAMSALGSLLSRFGELLPINHPGRADQLFWFNCTTLVDALDERQTIAKRFEDGGMYAFDRLWFKPQMLREAQVFMVPQCKGFLLCTDTFKQHIEALGLTGLRFTLKWSDEREGIERINAWEKMAYKGSLPPIPVP